MCLHGYVFTCAYACCSCCVCVCVCVCAHAQCYHVCFYGPFCECLCSCFVYFTRAYIYIVTCTLTYVCVLYGFMQVKRCFISSSRVSQHHQQTVSHLRSARARQEAIPPLREALRQRGGAVMTRSRLRHTPMYVMCVSLSLNNRFVATWLPRLASKTLLVHFQPTNFVDVVPVSLLCFMFASAV